MHGVRVENQKTNLGVTEVMQEQSFLQKCLQLKRIENQRCVCVNKQKVHHIVMVLMRIFQKRVLLIIIKVKNHHLLS